VIGPLWMALHDTELQPKLQPRIISLGICVTWPVARPDLGDGLSASDRLGPLFTAANGPLMARSVGSGGVGTGGLASAS
jgi:hypothetical protein